MRRILIFILIFMLVCGCVGVVVNLAASNSSANDNRVTFKVKSDLEGGVLDLAKLSSGQVVTVTLTPDEGYSLPESVTVTGAKGVYDPVTGSLTLSNAVDNVEIVAEFVPIEYPITVELINGQYVCDRYMTIDDTVVVTLVPNSGYSLPDSIMVSGVATRLYDDVNGTVSLSHPTGNVTISGECVPNTYTISVSMYNVSVDGATSVSTGSTAVVILSAASGYTLPDSVTVEGADGQYDPSTGVLTLSNPIDDVIVSGVCPQLDAGASSEEVQHSHETFEVGYVIGGYDFGNTHNGSIDVSMNTFLANLPYDSDGNVALVLAANDMPLIMAFRDAETGGHVLAVLTANDDNGITIVYSDTDFTGSGGLSEGYHNLINGKVMATETLPAVGTVNEWPNARWNGVTISYVQSEGEQEGEQEEQPEEPASFNVTILLTNGAYGVTTTIYPSDCLPIYLSANAGYSLPASLSVSGASIDQYDNQSGELYLIDVYDDVTVSGVCEPNTYTVTVSVSNGTYSGDTSIQTNDTAIVTLVADSGYSLPSSISVIGADYAYDPMNGEVSLSNPSDNVAITAACSQNNQQLPSYTLTVTGDFYNIAGAAGFVFYLNGDSTTLYRTDDYSCEIEGQSLPLVFNDVYSVTIAGHHNYSSGVATFDGDNIIDSIPEDYDCINAYSIILSQNSTLHLEWGED